MKTSTIIKPLDSRSSYENMYSHDLVTDSIDINVCNNCHCDDTTDRTFVMIKTMYGDSILINQVDGHISINGTKIQLKGRRNS